MKRRKFTAKFKTSVVLEALKERESVSELAQKHGIAPQQINSWKRAFLAGAERAFDAGPKSGEDQPEDRDKLLKTIGTLKVENDFLRDALRR